MSVGDKSGPVKNEEGVLVRALAIPRAAPRAQAAWPQTSAPTAGTWAPRPRRTARSRRYRATPTARSGARPRVPAPPAVAPRRPRRAPPPPALRTRQAGAGDKSLDGGAGAPGCAAPTKRRGPAPPATGGRTL